MARHYVSPVDGLVRGVATRAIKWRGRRYQPGAPLPAMTPAEAEALGERIVAGATEADIEAEVRAGRLPPDAAGRLDAGETVEMSSRAVRPPEGGGQDGNPQGAGEGGADPAGDEAGGGRPPASPTQDIPEGRSGTAREAPSAPEGAPSPNGGGGAAGTGSGTDEASAASVGAQPAAPHAAPAQSAGGKGGVSNPGRGQDANAATRRKGRAGR